MRLALVAVGSGLAGGRGAAFGAEAEIPKGEVTKYSFAESKIFPGTVRDYWIYVPRQYDPAKPACLYVNQDGIQYNAPAVFDELIHRKEMPVTIGVFVMHGRVKAPSDQALDRFNRSYEYDGLGDNYARFLIEELLPEVEKKTASDGRPIKLSQDGNDRGIGGASSGAICAFTAAWERPDSFRRVFSSIGTYVGLRGGNDYPTLVRKTEPKPLRVFLEDGSNDLNIYGGDWWMANQEMERALTFAGYQVNHVWGEGGHNTNQATKIFPEAMRWLWKDWPKPIEAGRGSQQLQDVLIPGEGWTLVAEGYKLARSPAANARGEVFFSDVPERKSFKIGLDGKVSLLSDRTGAVGCQAFAPDGRLIAAGRWRELVVKVEEDGSAVSTRGEQERVVSIGEDGKATVLDEGLRGDDLTMLHNGSIYLTDSFFGGPIGDGKIWRIAPTGERTGVDTGRMRPYAICVSPDQTLLYVAEMLSHWVYSYQIQPDGTLAHKQKYYHLHVPDTAENSEVGGMKVDRDGRLYVATRMGIQICDQAGRVNCIVPVPNGKISNLCFGGPEFNVLYATCGDRVYKRKVKTTGANAWQPPLKPAAPRL